MVVACPAGQAVLAKRPIALRTSAGRVGQASTTFANAVGTRGGQLATAIDSLEQEFLQLSLQLKFSSSRKSLAFLED